MNINEKIVSLLFDVNLPVYFIHKPNDNYSEKIDDFITFNYRRNNNWYSNDVSEVEQFSVTLNYITKSIEKVVDTKNLILEQLKNNDRVFSVVDYQTVYDNSTSEFLSVITFTILM